jgi:hypothetical protein
MKKYHSIIICAKCSKKMEVRNDYIKFHKGLCMSCQSTGNKNAQKHGDCKERLYRIWKGIFFRKYIITANVCKDWYSYIEFKKWALDNGYSHKLTIDRKNNKNGYSPENCQWISLAKNSGKDKQIFSPDEMIPLYMERKESGLTQKEFAVIKGVSRNTIFRSEKYAKGEANVE